MEKWGKLAIGTTVAASFTIPVFRSGGRTHLTFWQWVWNHTIFGPPVEYVPEEDYTRELEGVEMPRQLPSGNQIEEAKAYHQISEPSARELLSHQSERRQIMKGSFSLSIVNAPPGSEYWWAKYPGYVSPELAIGETWNCPYGAYGTTDLTVYICNIDWVIIYAKYGLGPIYDDKDYVYDCSTEELYEVVPPEKKKFPWAPVAIGVGAVATLGLLVAKKRR